MSNGEIFCCGEQVSCINYRADYLFSFRHRHLPQGEIISDGRTDGFYWIFVLDGKISVTGPMSESVGKGEMIIVPSLVKYRVKCESDVDAMFFISDHPKEYSTALVGRLKIECEKISFRLNKLSICRPLDIFLKLLADYLAGDMSCGHLQEEKQEELFILLNNYYTIDDLKIFLYPYVMQKDMDFKKIVLLHSQRAKSVQELVDLCGYTMSGFKKIFKEMFDEPIYQWMLQQKAEKLRRKLLEDDVNLKGLIDEFEFSSPAHFTKFCKKWLGKTPTQFMDEAKSQREQFNL